MWDEDDALEADDDDLLLRKRSDSAGIGARRRGVRGRVTGIDTPRAKSQTRRSYRARTDSSKEDADSPPQDETYGDSGTDDVGLSGRGGVSASRAGAGGSPWRRAAQARKRRRSNGYREALLDSFDGPAPSTPGPVVSTPRRRSGAGALAASASPRRLDNEDLFDLVDAQHNGGDNASAHGQSGSARRREPATRRPSPGKGVSDDTGTESPASSRRGGPRTPDVAAAARHGDEDAASAAPSAAGSDSVLSDSETPLRRRGARRGGAWQPQTRAAQAAALASVDSPLRPLPSALKRRLSPLNSPPRRSDASASARRVYAPRPSVLFGSPTGPKSARSRALRGPASTRQAVTSVADDAAKREQFWKERPARAARAARTRATSRGRAAIEDQLPTPLLAVVTATKQPKARKRRRSAPAKPNAHGRPATVAGASISGSSTVAAKSQSASKLHTPAPDAADKMDALREYFSNLDGHSLAVGRVSKEIVFEQAGGGDPETEAHAAEQLEQDYTDYRKAMEEAGATPLRLPEFARARGTLKGELYDGIL